MQFDFAAILVIAALVTGSVWLLDIVFLAPRRQQAPAAGRADGGAVAGSRTEADSRKKDQKSRVPWYVDYARSFFPVILAVLVLRSFIVEPFRIPSGSMMPTLLAGDFILVNKFSYGVRLPVINTKIIDTGGPQRGDVAVFRYPEDPSVAFIKRIVGLPGDRLEYSDNQLYINGERVPQQVLSPDAEGFMEDYELRLEELGDVGHRILVRENSGNVAWNYEVPEGHYFTMGDNRDNSRDSRFWGPLPEENLVGEAFLIWMNWDCITGNGHCSRIGDVIR